MSALLDRLRWWRSPLLLSEVIVNMKHDGSTALRGVLTRSRGEWLTLSNPQIVSATGTTPMVGEVWIRRENVAWVQRPPAGT